MSDDEIVSFDEAKEPHIHKRKEGKLAKLRGAFKSVTDESLKAKKLSKKPTRNQRKRNNKKKR